MKHISDGENKYFLKASMAALIQMDEMGISANLMEMQRNQNQLGFKVIFEMFHLFLNAGEGVKYTKSEAMDIYERIVNENGFEYMAKFVQEVMEEDVIKAVQKNNFKKGVVSVDSKKK